jgi:FkbM family methyltransferase
MNLATFPQFNRQKACRYGQMLYNVNDMYIGRSLDLYGEFSEGEVELFRQIVEPGHVVIEVGANIGAHTVFLARQVGPQGLVLAFEPQRVVFQTLCANIALNSLPNVVCMQNAVGAAQGTIKVPLFDYTRTNNFGGLSLGRHTVGEDVAVVPLDIYNLPRCNLIKVDVEGMEEEVLRGAASMIARFKPLLYVENDREEKSASLIRYIDSLGYTLHWHKPAYYNPKNFLANAHNEFPNIASFNMLCVHKDIPQSLRGFEPVEIPPAAPSPA